MKQAKLANRTHHTNVIMGNVSSMLSTWVRDGSDFYYLDHAYFKRGWSTNNFRCIRRGLHLTKVNKRPDDRLKKFDVQIEPWRKERGSKIVMIPTYMTHEAIYPGLARWMDDTKKRIGELTDRPVVVKREKGGLRQYLEDAWCVVASGSVAAVEAALMGVPVFCSKLDPAYPVSNPLEKIENPDYPERFDWACSLAYAQWNAEEIDRVNWIDYDYALCNDLSS